MKSIRPPFAVVVATLALLLDAVVACDVVVDILFCSTTTGRTPCEGIVAPRDVLCFAPGEFIDTVTFSYQNRTCAAPVPRDPDKCSQINPMNFSLEIEVVCEGLLDNSQAFLDVNPSRVSPTDSFSVSAPQGVSFPKQMGCVLSQDGIGMIQRISIDFFDKPDRALKDQVGALTLESCDDKSCLEEVQYDVALINSGTDDLTIESVLVSIDGDGPVEGVNDVMVNPLQPGEPTIVTKNAVIDICTPREVCADVEVEGSSLYSEECQDDDQYCFTIEIEPEPAQCDDLICTRTHPYSFNMSEMYGFMCVDDGDTFQLDGHATVLCDEPLLNDTDANGDPLNGTDGGGLYPNEDFCYGAMYWVMFECNNGSLAVVSGNDRSPLVSTTGEVKIGQVVTTVVGDNVEVTIEVSGDDLLEDDNCCLKETHICNYPMERVFTINKCDSIT